MQEIDGIFILPKRPGQAGSVAEAIELLQRWGEEHEVVPVIGERAPGEDKPFVTGWLKVVDCASLTDVAEFDTFKEALAHIRSQPKPDTDS